MSSQPSDFVVIASGPSLTVEDCERVRGIRTIAINSSWERAPWAHYIYACDLWWWQNNFSKIKAAKFEGELWTQDEAAAAHHKLNHVPSVNNPGLGRGGVIHQGMNSGYQAINLAYLWGARRIMLLGFDMRLAPNGHAHFHKPHRPSTVYRFGPWIEAMKQLAIDLEIQGVRVINATRETDLDCFERMDLESACALFSA